jgi:putative membrane protein
MTFFHWLVLVIAILLAAYLVPGVHVTLVGAIVLAVVLGLINIFVKPIIGLLTLPINILTLGISWLIINALIIMLLSLVVPGFGVTGFWAAFFFSIVLSLINALFHLGVSKPNRVQ